MYAPRLGLWDGNPASWAFGATLRAYGYGRNVDGGDPEVENGTTGAGTLRFADLRVSSVGNLTFQLDATPNGQIVWRGDSGGPSVLFQDSFGRLLPGIAGVHRQAAVLHDSATDGLVPAERAVIKRHIFAPGDSTGDLRADIMLTGGVGWGSIPVASPLSGGGFSVTNSAVDNFPTWAQVPGVRVVSGDFDGDGRADLALTGGSNWTTVPVAFSNGNGTFSVTNTDLEVFPAWAATAGVKALPGDFDGDGFGDIALTGGSGWTTIPVAFSLGSGRFIVSNLDVSNFPSWSASAGAKVVSGDFNGDGRDDLAVTGVSGWTTVPVAFSNGQGGFAVTNNSLATFPALATQPTAQAVAGDFDGDGRDDIALAGGAGLGTIPIALSQGNGSFVMVIKPVANFPGWAATAGVKVVVGEFNGDLFDDIALTGPSGWTTIPVAYSNGDGSFNVTNVAVVDFPFFASQAGAKAVSGH